MQTIQGILFEPVGCLAEFPPEPFNEIAARLFGRRKKPSKSASRSYWHLLNLMEAADRPLAESDKKVIEDLEIQAIEAASVFEDVIPALSELKAMGVKLVMATSLSKAAITRFIENAFLNDFFPAVSSRDNAEGVKAAPLRNALEIASLEPEHSMFLTDSAEGLKMAGELGLNSILMMNDPDEAMRLSAHNPSGGIVSLHELPDFIRLVAAENARRV
jgi:phosphoglycolate phosphatase-like HAD superfamily hydrolase